MSGHQFTSMPLRHPISSSPSFLNMFIQGMPCFNMPWHYNTQLMGSNGYQFNSLRMYPFTSPVYPGVAFRPPLPCQTPSQTPTQKEPLTPNVGKRKRRNPPKVISKVQARTREKGNLDLENTGSPGTTEKCGKCASLLSSFSFIILPPPPPTPEMAQYVWLIGRDGRAAQAAALAGDCYLIAMTVRCDCHVIAM